MARGGGQIQYGFQPGANQVVPQIPPWLALLQAASSGFGAYQQSQALESSKAADTARLQETQNKEMRQQATERQAFARLMGLANDPATGPLDSATQAQLDSTLAGIGNANVSSSNVRSNLAQAPAALAGVEQKRRTNRALQEINRMISELGAVQPTSAGDASKTPVAGRGASAPLLDQSQQARVRSALETMRAQIETNPESADQLSQLAVQLGVDPQGRITMAQAEEQIRTSRERRDTDEQATQVLARLNPEVFGDFEGPIFGAGDYLRDENNYLRQRQLDAQRANDAASLERQRTRNARAEGAASAFQAAYTSAFQMFYSRAASGPGEGQPGAPDALARAQNETEAYLRRRGFEGEIGQLEEGRRAQLSRFGAATVEATKYAQELMQNHVQNRQEPIEVGTHRFRTDTTLGALGNILTPQETRNVAAPAPLTQRDREEYLAAIRVRLRHQLGIDEDTAELALEHALINEQFDIFNKDLQASRRAYPGASSRDLPNSIGAAFGAGLPGAGIVGEALPTGRERVRVPFETVFSLPPSKREDIIRRLSSDQFKQRVGEALPPNEWMMPSRPTIVGQ